MKSESVDEQPNDNLSKCIIVPSKTSSTWTQKKSPCNHFVSVNQFKNCLVEFMAVFYFGTRCYLSTPLIGLQNDKRFVQSYFRE